METDRGRSLPHLWLQDTGVKERFSSPLIPRGNASIPPRERVEHADRLANELSLAFEASSERLNKYHGQSPDDLHGHYIEFSFPKSQNRVLDKLEYRRGNSRIEIVAVRPSLKNPENEIIASVYVPESRKGVHFKKIAEYRDIDTAGMKPKNQPLIASINSICMAQVQSLFTDDMELFPNEGESIWWEIWLRSGMRADFEVVAKEHGMDVKEQTIKFFDREVIAANATSQMIEGVIANSSAVAELRATCATLSEFPSSTPAIQLNSLSDIERRVSAPGSDAPSVCVLDSGTTRAHPLIEKFLENSDQHTLFQGSTGEDTGKWGGHGTGMSGLAVHGDLKPLSSSTQVISVGHCLESVKILPDDPRTMGAFSFENGELVIRASTVVEAVAPDRRRVYCLAITTTEEIVTGNPTSWSSALDKLCHDVNGKGRLIVVSAGNIRSHLAANQYLQLNDDSPIQNPAHSWNALTVGAITENVSIHDPNLSGWNSIAPSGDLTPSSRTSVKWRDALPVKPDVVAEGGNFGVNGQGNIRKDIPDLCLLTARNDLDRPIMVFGETSAATALVSRMAARIIAENHSLRPETVRALVVHSAEWTPAMLRHWKIGNKRTVLRRYGYGVPNLNRAIGSERNDVTFVIEGSIQPFERVSSVVRTREMAYHGLPWPYKILESLGDAGVEMKVTLSYFVEPCPSRRGDTRRHKHQSHGLRFSVKRAGEDIENFRKRINRAARNDNDDRPEGVGADEGWMIGPQLRDRGSIHSDTWKGSAENLAQRGGVAVYPTGGWWREKGDTDRHSSVSNYTLLVTLRAEESVDLYTEVATATGVSSDTVV